MRLPSWISLLLRWVVSRDRREDILGDLHELHAQRSEDQQGLVAWLGTCKDAAILIAALAAEAIRENADLGNWISGLDLRHGIRLIKKRPLLNLTAFAALTVAIGLSNVGFTVLDQALFGRLPEEDGERFVKFHARMGDGRWTALTPQQFDVVRSQSRALDFVGGLSWQNFYLGGNAGAVESVRGVEISPDFFSVVTVRPLVGRTLIPSDGDLGAEPVVVIRESLWRSRFGADHEAVGQMLEVSGVERTVVGVLPDEVRFPNSPLVWTPLGDLAASHDEYLQVRLFGIHGASSSLESVQKELDLLTTRFEADESGERVATVQAWPYLQELTHGEMWTLAGTFILFLGSILLVMAANVGNLVMVKTACRSSEIAIRSALGAGRRRLMALLAAELALLVSIATVAGFALSSFGRPWFRGLFTEAPYWASFDPNPRTLGATALAALLVTLTAGLGPTLRVGRTSASLKSGAWGGVGFRVGRLGSTMTIFQMAISLALVSTAVVAARGALGHGYHELGLPEEEVLTAQFWLPVPEQTEGGEDPEASRKQALEESRRAMIEAVGAIPGVSSVGPTSTLPGMRARSIPTDIEGTEASVPHQTPVVAVLPGFFEALDVEPVLGRLIRETDLGPDAARVAVINERFARERFEGMSPLGHRLRMRSESEPDGYSPWHEIVGVVPDLGLNLANPEKSGGYYVPMEPGRVVDLAIRVVGDPSAYEGALRQAAAQTHREILLMRIQPLEKITSKAAFTLSVYSMSFTFLGGMALFLSIVGVFTVTSLDISRRTREIGLRTALGASPRDLVVWISRRATFQLVAGIGLGSLLAFLTLGMVRAAEYTFPEAQAHEPLAVALALALSVALACCWWPARRIMGISPAEALGED
ncbi:MAG: ABC transporter permease [Thermoanaerobaculia bacterium]|nr:ABC transporter permease [Thermoanaerobaculia bacterium]